MRQPTSTSTPTNNISKTLPIPTIPSSAALAITMTTSTPSKRRHAQKYRPLERSDGVVTVYPPYRPSTSPPRSELKFEPKLFTLPTQASSAPIKATNFCAIGAQFDHKKGNGHNSDVVERGRGGYNVPYEARRRNTRMGGEVRGLMMERFLAEESGPWSTFALRAT